MGNPKAHPRQRRPSIKSVAALAGVSWSTVSNVLNNPSSVRPQTRAKVEDAIEALGYRPNAAGRNLRRGTCGSVLLRVTPLTDPLNAEITQALVLEAQERGLDSHIETCRTDSRGRYHLPEGDQRLTPDGVVIVGHAPPRPVPAHAKVPVAVVGNQAPPPARQVLTDPVAQAQMVVDHLHGAGARRFLLASHAHDLEPALDALARALGARGLPMGSGSVLLPHQEGGAVSYRLERALDPAAHTGPTALVCSGEAEAHDVVAELLRLRERVPSNIMLAGLGVSRAALDRIPGLVAAPADTRALASAALDALLAPDDAPRIRLIRPFPLA